MLLQEGSIDEAISHFRRALELNPDYFDAHQSLGNALGQTGQFDEAIAELATAVRLQPSEERAQRNLRATIGARDQAKRAGR